MKYSIIIPAYNMEKYISDAIESVISQTYKEWECIIVDDGSTDLTGNLIDEYAIKDSRIRALHQKHSGTAASARNTALNHVTGEYIQFLDADDRISNDCLEKNNYAIQTFKKKYKFSDHETLQHISMILPIALSFNDNN